MCTGFPFHHPLAVTLDGVVWRSLLRGLPLSTCCINPGGELTFGFLRPRDHLQSVGKKLIGMPFNAELFNTRSLKEIAQRHLLMATALKFG
jgi:hypothetical protein